MNTPPLHNTDEQRVASALHSIQGKTWVDEDGVEKVGIVGYDQAKSAILSLLAEARMDEWLMISEEVELNKPRSKYVRNVYLPISYIQKRIAALRQKESKDERS